MTTANAAQSRPGLLVAGAERNTGTFLGGLYRLWSDHRRYRATLGELGGLSERQLKDLGLSRGDIRSTARLAVYGK
jgi:uncharacterized protein YjiS (DUF1127 family)